jgi:hypothetical protein
MWYIDYIKFFPRHLAGYLMAITQLVTIFSKPFFSDCKSSLVNGIIH